MIWYGDRGPGDVQGQPRWAYVSLPCGPVGGAARSGVVFKAEAPTQIGWHYLSNGTCPRRPLLFYALFVVSRIIIVCYMICNCWAYESLRRRRGAVLKYSRPKFQRKEMARGKENRQRASTLLFELSCVFCLRHSSARNHPRAMLGAVRLDKLAGEQVRDYPTHSQVQEEIELGGCDVTWCNTTCDITTYGTIQRMRNTHGNTPCMLGGTTCLKLLV